MLITELDVIDAEQRFDFLTDVLHFAHAVAWDRCHKIYIVLDEIERDRFIHYGYTIADGTPADMLVTLRDWYDQSCPLVMINSARSNPQHDPNNASDCETVFTTVIPQFTEYVVWAKG